MHFGVVDHIRASALTQLIAVRHPSSSSFSVATLSARAGSANIFVYNSSVHIPDSFKLVEEFHGKTKVTISKFLIV
jgi:hypothetical protein